jgi:hypothetical protein
MRARKKGEKSVELKPLTLKVQKHIWLAWKIQAAREETTMSELAERLVSAYVAGEAGVDSEMPNAGSTRRDSAPKPAKGPRPRYSKNTRRKRAR